MFTKLTMFFIRGQNRTIQKPIVSERTHKMCYIHILGYYLAPGRSGAMIHAIIYLSNFCFKFIVCVCVCVCACVCRQCLEQYLYASLLGCVDLRGQFLSQFLKICTPCFVRQKFCGLLSYNALPVSKQLSLYPQHWNFIWYKLQHTK